MKQYNMTILKPVYDYFDDELQTEVINTHTRQLNNHIDSFYEVCDIVIYFSSINEESEAKELATALVCLGQVMYPDTDLIHVPSESHVDHFFEEFGMSDDVDVNQVFLDIIQASLPTAYQNIEAMDNLVNKCRAVRKAMFPNK